MLNDDAAVEQGTQEHRRLVVVRRQTMFGPDRYQVQRTRGRRIFLQVDQAADRSIAVGMLF